MTDSVPENKISAWLWPIAGAILCLGLGTASGLATVSGGGAWYQGLMKPPGTPPPWIFGPVWSVLYVLMGIAAGRLIHRRAGRAATFFVIQFVLNLAWTPVFFGAHQVAAAMVILVMLWLVVAVMVFMALRLDLITGLILFPYLAWLCVAAALNFSILRHNR